MQKERGNHAYRAVVTLISPTLLSSPAIFRTYEQVQYSRSSQKLQEAVFRRGEPFRICRKASGRERAAHAPPEAPFEGRPVPRSEGIAVKYNYYSFIVALPFQPFSSENIPDTGAKEPPPAPVSRRAETGRKTAVFPSMGGLPSHENRKSLISPCNLQGKPYHMYNNSNLPSGQNAHAIRNEE